MLKTRRGELSLQAGELGSSSARRCGRCPRSSTASPTSRPATASATSTWSPTTRSRRPSRSARRSSPRSAASSTSAASSRSRRRCCSRSTAAPWRAPSSRTTTRSSATSTCASPPSSTSSAASSAASSASTRSARTSATRASRFKHNPEFTMLETYEAYVDYNHVMTMVEEMVAAAARSIGDLKVEFKGDDDRPHAALAAAHHAPGDPRQDAASTSAPTTCASCAVCKTRSRPRASARPCRWRRPGARRSTSSSARRSSPS